MSEQSRADPAIATATIQPASPRRISALVAWLGIVFLAAAIGGIGSMDAPEFYAALNRPAWAPPAGLFGPVWSVLYALMGIAIWLVWRERTRVADAGRAAVVLFVLQLGANALWSWTFFVWHSGSLAFANILVLDALVVATILAFRRLHPLAAALLLPYGGWIAFATALTYSTWQRNPALL